MSDPTRSNTKQISWIGLLNLLTVYIVWGSTYLAIRIAVRDGLGFPPFFLAASRVILAGSLLLLFAVLQRQRIRLNRNELIVLAISGSLLWVGGNGLVSWSEQKVSSGLAALIVGATPIFVALMESAVDRKIPSLLLVGSLLIGFGGIVILTFPVIRSGIRSDVLSAIGLLVASFSWGAGSLLQSRNPVRISPFVSSGYQHLFGAFGLVILSLITKENFQSPLLEAWLAWGYLVVFGSVIAFTSFINVLQILPTNIVMTYSYVNPVIAVFLGWIVLDERITVWTIAGTLLVLLGVWGVFRTRYKKSA